MSQPSVPLMDLLARRMEWLSVRQRVVAQNVANVNTPGYLAKDLKEPGFAALLRGQGSKLPLAGTAAGPAKALLGSAGAANGKVTEKGYEITPTGTGVQLESEMMKLSETQMEHDTVSGLYRKNMAMIRMALGGGTR
ncbi:flagellar basal body rod protein FlgB [Zavarzinia sp. CC-PAN008]|uniref:flagellar basal body rod protein FlgB n=1 Tax=Zavarzinia sp. CC-PAN008 TaxID=3243332 RepID=UPI003F7470D3